MPQMTPLTASTDATSPAVPSMSSLSTASINPPGVTALAPPDATVAGLGTSTGTTLTGAIPSMSNLPIPPPPPPTFDSSGDNSDPGLKYAIHQARNIAIANMVPLNTGVSEARVAAAK